MYNGNFFTFYTKESGRVRRKTACNIKKKTGLSARLGLHYSVQWTAYLWQPAQLSFTAPFKTSALPLPKTAGVKPPSFA